MKRRSLATFLAAGSVSILVGSILSHDAPADGAHEEVPRETRPLVSTPQPIFRQLLPRDTIHPVYSPRFIPAAGAPLRPDELVIGVEIRGEARAYPIETLNLREMVNDRIGPVPYLVTW